MPIRWQRPPWDRGGLRTYLVIIALVACRGDSRAVLWGLAPFLPGLALHVYAKGCLRQNQAVSRGGPYRFVRHPFYSANFLIDEGLAVMSGWWPLMVLLPVWWLAVYLPVMAREERTLCELFPDIYPDYQRRLPRLVPWRRPLPAEGERFSWSNPNIVADTVLPRQLRLLAYPWLFLLCQLVRAEGLSLFTPPQAYRLWIAVVPVTLYGLSRELARHLKHRQRLLPEWMARAPFRAGFAGGLLLAAAAFRVPEAYGGLPAAAAGGAALLVSLIVLVRRAWLCAEGAALTGAVILCAAPWLAALPLLLHTALGLDRRLATVPRDAAEPVPSGC
jgi:hypothetical protein